MDRLAAMRVFARVAELNSFSAVAHQQGVARSVVTRQVAALEEHLGVKLMARSTRRLTLTSAGAAYLEKCRVILNLVEAAETGVAEQRHVARGHIRVSLPLSYGLKRMVPLLLDFAREHPEVSLDMDYTDRRVNLIEEGVDLAIRITGRLGQNEVARKMGVVRMHTFASPDYLARFGCPRHPSELAQHECLGYTMGGAPGSWTYRVDGGWMNFPVQSRISASNGDALTEAAAQGLGITIQPDFVVGPFIDEGRVTSILEDFEMPELGLYAMLPGNRQVPHRVRVMMDFIAARIVPSTTPAAA
jgi:DNA-binding transcriptional LysR family regulator